MNKIYEWPLIIQNLWNIFVGCWVIGTTFLPDIPIWAIRLNIFLGSALLACAFLNIYLSLKFETTIEITKSQFCYILNRIKNEKPEWLKD